MSNTSSKAETVFQNTIFDDQHVSKLNNFTGQHLTTNTYYFRPGQSTDYQQTGTDQVFIILKGSGHCYLNNGQEEVIDVTEGSIVYIPEGVQSKFVNTHNSEMIATEIYHPHH